MTDANQVLTSYTKSTGPNPGQDNNSQVNPYCIQNFNPTGVGDTNLTADFSATAAGDGGRLHVGGHQRQ
ncbi:MAG: hypothetical protein IPH87_26980 [Anaerolineae bacterium]|nr:hypothetical protein [Anaerolineae bacterium]